MKRLIILIVLLVSFTFAVPCWAKELPNLFRPETRVAVDSEIDPWDILVMVGNEHKCLWITDDVVPCPEGDLDFHIIITNPNKEAEVNKVELVIADGRTFLPLGVLCSYSYIKDGVWHMFYYDFDKDRYIKYTGKPEYGHGGTIFNKK